MEYIIPFLKFLSIQKGFTIKVCTAFSSHSFTNLPFWLLIPTEELGVNKVGVTDESFYIIHRQTQAP